MIVRIAIAAAALAGYLALGALVASAPPGGIDAGAAALAGHGVGLALFFTGAGRFPVFAALCALLLIFGFIRRRYLAPLAVIVAALALAWKISDVFKDLYHRPRPAYWIDIHETSFGYSSGHATLSLTFYGLLAYLVWRTLPPSTLRSAVPVAAAAWILATGWSRLALGAHYPTDVLGGYLLGAVFVLLGSLVLDRTLSRTTPTT